LTDNEKKASNEEATKKLKEEHIEALKKKDTLYTELETSMLAKLKQQETVMRLRMTLLLYYVDVIYRH